MPLNEAIKHIVTEIRYQQKSIETELQQLEAGGFFSFEYVSEKVGNIKALSNLLVREIKNSDKNGTSQN